jgi:GDP-4-dehydro-6-deoxy-D-mannose reductase
MSTILLTGASGFIGTRLIRHLSLAGATIVSVGRRAPDAAAGGSTHLPVSELSAAAIRAAVGGTRIDAIVHLAAAGVRPGDRDAQLLTQLNAILPAELPALGREIGARAIIIAGSNAEYARHDGPIEERCTLETVKLYGATKAAGGLLAVANGIAHAVPTVNLRLFNVFGPGEAAHRLLPSLVDALAAGVAVPLSTGLQVRDFVHVDDVCRAILMAIEGAIDGSVPSGHYNVCTGHGHSVRDFALAVAKHMGVSPSLLNFGALPLRPDDLPRVVGSPDAFMSRVSWHPAQPFDSQLAQAVAELIPVESVPNHD